MNLKLRLQNKVILSALIGVVITAIFEIAQLFGLELSVTQDQIMSIVEVILTVLVGLGVVVDPTTKGIKDSEQAMGYTEPKTE